jgi:peptide/nickel transport system substrate-binding protein
MDGLLRIELVGRHLCELARLLASLVAILAVAGCVPSALPATVPVTRATTPLADADTRPGGTLVVGMAADSIVTLDPAAYSDRATETVVRNVFDGLVTRTTDNRVVLELARAYRWLDDSTIEFELKEGVTFHNGEDLTAEDVVFTVDRILNQEVGGPRRVFVSEVKSVEQVGEYAVRFHLDGPWPVLLQMLVHIQIVPKTYLTEVGDEAFSRNPVGCGPFRFVEGDLAEQVVLERFEGYYGGADELRPVGAASLERVIFRMMPEAADRLQALQDGSAHIIQSLPPSLVSQLANDPNIIIKTVVGTRPKFVDLNVTRPPFDDPRVRRALNYAVDAHAVLTRVAGGYGVLLPGPLSPANLYADPTLEPYGYDPEKARLFLRAAGYAPQDISFTIDAYGPYVEIADAVADQLREFGMDVTVSTWEYAQVRPLLLACGRQAFLRDWGDSAFDPVGYIEAKWQTRVEGTPAGRANFACYSNARVDDLIELGASESGHDERVKAYYEAQRLIFEDAPAIFLYVPQEVEAASARVRNWEPSPDGRINLHDVWLSEE